MRSRLILKLISIVVTLVISIIGARDLMGSASSSLDPGNIARSGMTGLCADQQAVQNAGGPGAVTTVAATSSGALGALGKVAGVPLTCSTTTVP